MCVCVCVCVCVCDERPERDTERKSSDFPVKILRKSLNTLFSHLLGVNNNALWYFSPGKAASLGDEENSET